MNNNIERFVQHIVMTVKKLEVNDSITLKSTKLNRSILIEKNEAGCNVHENGVNTKTFKKVSEQELGALLRILIKMEFSADPMIKVSTVKAKDKDSEISSEE